MSTKAKVLIGVIVLAGAFAAGRFTTPVKVKIETKIVEVEKKTTDKAKDTDKHKTTTTITTKHPDGSETTTTTITEDTESKAVSHNTTDTTTDTATTKEVTKNSSPVTIQAMVGIPVSFGGSVPPIYGGSISKPVLGPVVIGVWGMSNATAGVSVGLTF